MATYLVKTEPETYSFADLVREGRCTWDGVGNPGALIHLRRMKKGDRVFVYHTGAEKAVVGIAEVAKSAYEDPAQPGKNDAGEPRLAVVDLKPVRALKAPVTLATIKADKRFAEFALVRQGRLSVMEVPEELVGVMEGMGGGATKDSIEGSRGRGTKQK